MAKPRPAEEGSQFWSLWETRIGVVGGVAGLLTLVLGLPGQVKEAIAGPGPEAAKVELALKRAALADAGPRLEVRYQFIDLIAARNDLANGRKAQPRGTVAATLRTYPIVENEISAPGADSSPRRGGCAKADQYYTTIAFLLVTNRGRRDASDVRIRVRRLNLDDPPAILLAGTGDEDPLRRLTASARDSEAQEIRNPTSLGPGEGVRVPLFLSAASSHRAAVGCVISSIALDPRSIHFTDPSLGSTRTLGVRRMASPNRVASGLVERG